MFLKLRCDTGARIFDEELDVLRLVNHAVAVGNPAADGMLQGIADEIGKHLRQSVGIGIHNSRHQRLLPFQFQSFGTAELEELQDAFTELVEVCHFLSDGNLSRLHTGKVEDFIDEAAQALVVTLNDLVVFHALLLGVGLYDNTGKALNSIQGGTDFMAHVG